LEKSQPKEGGRATEVTVGSLPNLHKTSPLILGTLHHLGVLDFVVTHSFFVTDLLHHNYMVNSSASTKVITLEVMNKLELKNSRPYQNVQDMDSREVEVCWVIKDLEVCLQEYPSKVFTMDTILNDCLTKWYMLLSRKRAMDTGGSIQMDWSYADILIDKCFNVRLFKKNMLHHVEDPKTLGNEPLYHELLEPTLGAYLLFING
jgi:hypothetical protein